MPPIGAPITVQNTDTGVWLVTVADAVTSTAGESVSFTVAVPRDASASLVEVQLRAVRQAIALLQLQLDPATPGS